jgi:hypothetical protein
VRLPTSNSFRRHAAPIGIPAGIRRAQRLPQSFAKWRFFSGSQAAATAGFIKMQHVRANVPGSSSKWTVDKPEIKEFLSVSGNAEDVICLMKSGVAVWRGRRYAAPAG